MTAPKLVFDHDKGGSLEVSLVEDGIEIDDSDADSVNSLSFAEAEHLHSWLEVVLLNRKDG